MKKPAGYINPSVRLGEKEETCEANTGDDASNDTFADSEADFRGVFPEDADRAGQESAPMTSPAASGPGPSDSLLHGALLPVLPSGPGSCHSSSPADDEEADDDDDATAGSISGAAEIGWDSL